MRFLWELPVGGSHINCLRASFLRSTYLQPGLLRGSRFVLTSMGILYIIHVKKLQAGLAVWGGCLWH